MGCPEDAEDAEDTEDEEGVWSASSWMSLGEATVEQNGHAKPRAHPAHNI